MLGDTDAPSLLVKFRLKGDKKSEVVLLTYAQYSNIKELPITLECRIVKNEKPTLSENDMIEIEKKIAKLTKSHTQSLSE